MKARGLDGTLELLPDRIRIKRHGLLSLLSHGLKGEKDILLSSISSIQFKKVGTFTSGYIQFTFAGGQETKGGYLNAQTDENTVTFSYYQRKAFDTIRTAIEARLSEIQTPPPPVADPVAASPYQHLEKLAELRDKGILTDEEFNVEKRKILSQ